MMTIDSKFKSLIQRQLVVFDFDETIIDCNSDSWIHSLAPGKKIPENIHYCHGQDYFKHVQSVLNYLHSQGLKEQDYIKCLAAMPSVPGVVDSLIETLGKQPEKYEMIILSDANSFFISSYLKSRNIESYFTTVLTNPAKFTDDGQLIISEYQVQDYCSLSARNLCKGEALKNFIGKRMLEHNTVYTCVNYIGDGENDYCPCTKLTARDRVFPRQGYSLNRLIATLDANQEQFGKDTPKLPEIKAMIIPWTRGEQILAMIAGTNSLV